ncbi:hypothetical protein FOYG_14089 [Fusarium oxysporum NRRL 32931]|uniref:Aminotransferase class I/classII large domain-containing protein n=1 Tax=Fusarium oxysporum NRRL 32931 TaxID=660029 RepID=W9HPV6_FUSOX|nr:hypothetical protein FOYG_14089 [Fusarium oxysporum NRRL 32931]
MGSIPTRSLSARGLAASEAGRGAVVWNIMPNIWDPDFNPDGFVSLGAAENALMHDTLNQYMRKSFSPSNSMLTYGDGMTGTKRLKTAMAQFLNRHLKPFRSLHPSHIKITNGCSSAIEHLVWALAEPGDGVLLGQPFYGTFAPDIELRFGAKLLKVPFYGVDPLSMEGVAAYENIILKSRANSIKTAALLLCNPHNPLGRCYPRSVIIQLMQLCEKYQIHFVCDEIYALSVWENTVDEGEPVLFESALSIDTTGIIESSRVHVIWGMSKDFGANGLRLGALISQGNLPLHDAILTVGLYSTPSLVSDQLTATILEDQEWSDSYLAENRRRIAEQYVAVTAWAKKHNIPYALGANAAFFMWLNLGAYFSALHPAVCQKDIQNVITKELLKHKVYIASGKDYGSEEVGWYRIVFTYKTTYLSEGLRRIIRALQGYGNK